MHVQLSEMSDRCNELVSQNKVCYALCTYHSAFTMLFKNMRILKFKTQPTVPFFTAANIIADVSENNDALRKMVYRSCLWDVVGRF